MTREGDLSYGHQRIWALMPWVLNHTASPDERRELESHLASCTDCRREYEFQQQLQKAVVLQPTPSGNPVLSLERLRQRLDGVAENDEGCPAPMLVSAPTRRRVWLLRGLAAAVVIQAIGLSVIGATLLLRTPAPVYQTLTTPAPATPTATLRVVFAPDLRLGDMQAMLQRAHLRIVGGPSEAGVYSLAPVVPDNQATAVALTQLRAQAAVRFAEPVADQRARPDREP